MKTLPKIGNVSGQNLGVGPAMTSPEAGMSGDPTKDPKLLPDLNIGHNISSRLNRGRHEDPLLDSNLSATIVAKWGTTTPPAMLLEIRLASMLSWPNTDSSGKGLTEESSHRFHRPQSRPRMYRLPRCLKRSTPPLEENDG